MDAFLTMNTGLWLLLMICNFAAILLFYKYFGKTGLYVWIAIAAILANIQVLKTMELFGQVVTLGNIIYGTSFLATDILSEIYGVKAAQKGVYIGLATLLIMTVLMSISLAFTPHESDFAQPALQVIFGLMPRVALGSFTAYFISQMHDVWAFAFWKRLLPDYKYLWVRNNFSTIISQLIDSLVFTFIAFYGLFAMEVFWDIVWTTFALKLLVAIADTPFMYLAVNMKVEEN